MEETFVLVYDIERKRPGCALIQVALGGTVPSEVFHMLFPAETWLTSLTDGMKGYTSTRADLERVSEITAQAWIECRWEERHGSGQRAAGRVEGSEQVVVAPLDRAAQEVDEQARPAPGPADARGRAAATDVRLDEVTP
jgi:hypothetical protein